MSKPSKVINNMIEAKLLNLHTAYFGKVISISDNTAKIQPLNMIKEKGEAAEKQAVVFAPILQTVKKFSTKTVTINGESVTIPVVKDVAAGDVVFVMCADRDITETMHGKCAVPAIGHHRISDSVIVGVM